MTATAHHGTPAAWRTDVQGLRGVAVLLVVAYHVGGVVPGGYFGVDVFLVLSGFLIGGLVHREVRATGGFALGRFVLRRVRRLLPALAVVLVVGVLAAAVVLPVGRPLDAALETAIGAATFRANLVLADHTGYFAAAADQNPFLHTWSLSLEEQFYLLLPLLVAGTVRVRRLRAVAVPLAGLVLTLPSVALLVLARTGVLEVDSAALFYGPWSRLWELGLGVLLGTVPAAARRGPGWFRSVGLALVLAAAAAPALLGSHPGVGSVLPVLGTLLVLAATGPSRVLEWRPLVWIGDRSYAWYLWHWPAIVVLRLVGGDRPWLLVAGAIGSLLPAAVSHTWVETPLRRLVLPRRILVTGAACLGVPVLLAAGGLVAGERAAAGTAAAMRPVAEDTAALTAATAPVGTGPTVLVLGDSHAQLLVPGLRTALAPHGISVLDRSTEGCPLLAGVPPVREECAAPTADALAALRSTRPSAVVLANYTPLLVDPVRGSLPPRWRLRGGDGAPVGSSAEALEVVGAGLSTLLAAADDVDAGAVVLRTVPHFERAGVPTLLAAWRGDASAPLLDRADVEQDRAATFAVERAAADATDAVVVDPLPLLCTDVCSPTRDGVLLWRDDNHLTEAGVALLLPALLDAIDEVAPGSVRGAEGA